MPLSILHINGSLVIRPRKSGFVPASAQPLTPREREVLALVAEGNSNKQIGDGLGISERTVKSHLTYIMTKLRASDRTHAVVTAVRLGWLAI
ncbi:MAG: response regulator transcription factor [Dehalococcoidia bacterium]